MAWYELEKSRKLMELYQRQIEKSDQVLKLLLASYSHSGKDFEEVLRIQQNILKYQIAEATAIKDYYLALAKLDYVTGKSE